MDPNLALSVVLLFLVLIFSLWLLWRRRWVRVKAMIAIALVPVSLPAVDVLFETSMGLTFSFKSIAGPTTAIAITAIVALAVLEHQANRRDRFIQSWNAIQKYLRMKIEGAGTKDLLNYIEDLQARPEIDSGAFAICQAIDILLADPKLVESMLRRAAGDQVEAQEQGDA